jgi:hypothetical protein
VERSNALVVTRFNKTVEPVREETVREVGKEPREDPMSELPVRVEQEITRAEAVALAELRRER